jgi:hypothetical protein
MIDEYFDNGFLCEMRVLQSLKSKLLRHGFVLIGVYGKPGLNPAAAELQSVTIGHHVTDFIKWNCGFSFYINKISEIK